MNVLQGKKSISCANNVLPAFMGDSSPGNCRGEPRRVQIDTTQNRPETFMGQILPAPAGSANRTAVIDHFKSYNDRLGYLQGDECLRAVAQAIVRQTRRGQDVVARFGG